MARKDYLELTAGERDAVTGWRRVGAETDRDEWTREFLDDFPRAIEPDANVVWRYECWRRDGGPPPDDFHTLFELAAHRLIPRPRLALVVHACSRADVKPWDDLWGSPRWAVSWGWHPALDSPTNSRSWDDLLAMEAAREDEAARRSKREREQQNESARDDEGRADRKTWEARLRKDMGDDAAEPLDVGGEEARLRSKYPDDRVLDDLLRARPAGGHTVGRYVEEMTGGAVPSAPKVRVQAPTISGGTKLLGSSTGGNPARDARPRHAGFSRRLRQFRRRPSLTG